MRRIRLSRRSQLVGFQSVQTAAVPHESALERDLVVLTACVDERASIISQPVTIKFAHQGATPISVAHAPVQA